MGPVVRWRATAGAEGDGTGDEVAQGEEDAEPHHTGHAEDAAVEGDDGELDEGDGEDVDEHVGEMSLLELAMLWSS